MGLLVQVVCAGLLTLAGCQIVFPVEPGEPPPACMSGDNATGFEQGCTPWGGATESGGARVLPDTDGMLLLTGTDVTSYAGCFGLEAGSFAPGATLQLTAQVDPATPTYFVFELFDADGVRAVLRLKLEAGQIVASFGDGEPLGRYTPALDAVLLLRWRPGGDGSFAEVSESGGPWVSLGEAPVKPDRIHPNIGLGTFTHNPTAQLARVGAYNLCP